MAFPYANTRELPWHLSVGAVARDDERRVLALRRPDGVVVMPTGALEPGETLEQALEREMREEAGVEGSVVRFLGAQNLSFTRDGRRYDKTILWHEVLVERVDETLRRHDDPEADAGVVWLTEREALETFNRQGEQLGDCNFSEPIINMIEARQAGR